MSEIPILNSILIYLLLLAVVGLIVWAIIKVVQFFVSASRRKNLELSKLAHEVEGLKHELKPNK